MKRVIGCGWMKKALISSKLQLTRKCQQKKKRKRKMKQETTTQAIVSGWCRECYPSPAFCRRINCMQKCIEEENKNGRRRRNETEMSKQIDFSTSNLFGILWGTIVWRAHTGAHTHSPCRCYCEIKSAEMIENENDKRKSIIINNNNIFV